MHRWYIASLELEAVVLRISRVDVFSLGPHSFRK